MTMGECGRCMVECISCAPIALTGAAPDPSRVRPGVPPARPAHAPAPPRQPTGRPEPGTTDPCPSLPFTCCLTLRRPVKPALLILSALVLAGSGCSDGAALVQDDPARNTGPDTLAGMNRAMLNDLADEIEAGVAYPDIHSLIVSRHGQVVHESYFGIGSATATHTLQSVSKSFASALVGIAISEGYIPGVDEHVLDFFPQWRDELAQDPRRAAMRLEDVLTMRSGNDYNEATPDAPHWELNRLSTGWDRFWLERPMVRDPGTVWQYDSGGVIALSSMIKFRFEDHADVYATDALFGPLGITDVRWFTNAEGHPHLGGGLHLRSRDMLKFGQMYLDRGAWEGRQVVPSAWVDSSFVRRVTFSPPSGPGGRILGYGYLWWILEPDPGGDGEIPVYAAIGAGGQYIFVVPESGLVVVVTAWMPENTNWRPVSFLYSDILPAIVRR